MMTRKLVLIFCIARVLVATAFYMGGTSEVLTENVTLRVMCAALGGSRNSRHGDQNGGFSAALESSQPDDTDASEA